MSGSFDLVVVGGGPAGMTCATAAAVAGRRVALVEREALGGQLNTVSTIDGRSGPDLAADLLDALLDAGVEVVYDEAVSTTDRTVVLGDDSTLQAATVVHATGSRVDLATVTGAVEAVGRGVSTCASCDAPLFRGRAVAVIGSGRDAEAEIADLAPYASSVTRVDPVDAVAVSGAPVRGLVLLSGETLDVEGIFVAGPREPVRLAGAATLIGDARPGADWTLAGAVADGERAASSLPAAAGLPA